MDITNYMNWKLEWPWRSVLLLQGCILKGPIAIGQGLATVDSLEKQARSRLVCHTFFYDIDSSRFAELRPCEAYRIASYHHSPNLAVSNPQTLSTDSPSFSEFARHRRAGDLRDFDYRGAFAQI